MKINMPVANEEYVLLENDSLVSQTDLSGLITFVNADFIRVSGYSEQELIGVAQNVVRHPDMPTEVFDDLWQALNAGRSWTGLIKNRNKKGGFYWVLENITPIVANARMVG